MKPILRACAVALSLLAMAGSAEAQRGFAGPAGGGGGGGGSGGGGSSGGGFVSRSAPAPVARPAPSPRAVQTPRSPSTRFLPQTPPRRVDVDRRPEHRPHRPHRPRVVVPYYYPPVYQEPITTYTYVDSDIDWDNCPALKRRALKTDSKYWWRKYRECRDRENDDD